ncbi:spore gernimation protein GerPD [Halobacillus amylolyticus]|uniref:Spore gernimation protein GerPD n=1 Tax=Halobacillus amylolyticus TaxID=2932259 RepID=A0ABY4HIB8_9BACI|nr:spore gernimation protein GerPD [Halobacillus amylolyticus]UOR13175.1 spore gernimation protein GerPD [Halobacillus amylolyticus]
MNYTVHNYGLDIGNIDVSSVASSSVFLIGDSETIRLYSYYDTPPESLIIGPFVPIEQEEGFTDE